MALRELKTINSKDYELATIQRNTSEFVDQLMKVPFIEGRLLEDLAVSTTATDFPHGLGRVARGYFIVKANAGVTLFDTASTTPAVMIKLTASATATISLWVF